MQSRLLARAQVLRSGIRAAQDCEPAREDADERATDDLEAGVTAAGVERDSDALLEIEAALRRLEGGTYGICVDCFTALPWARLDALPEAARCLRCEARHERAR